MAEQNSTSEDPGTFLTSLERVRIAAHASWMAESCATAAIEMLAQAVPADQVAREDAVRSMLIRLRDMAQVTSMALSDDAEDSSELQRRISGES